MSQKCEYLTNKFVLDALLAMMIDCVWQKHCITGACKRAEEKEAFTMTQITKDTAAICGLFCGLCPAYPDECGGCLSNRVREGCDVCSDGFRACAKEKGYKRCNECFDYFTCEKLLAFERDDCPHHTGVVANVGRMRELGVEHWLQEQIKINECPGCGKIMHWDREDCQRCGRKKG